MLQTHGRAACSAQLSQGLVELLALLASVDPVGEDDDRTEDDRTSDEASGQDDEKIVAQDVVFATSTTSKQNCQCASTILELEEKGNNKVSISFKVSKT